MERQRKQRGVTLVEAMIAMAIMLIGATGLASLSRQAMRFNADGRRLTSAVNIAMDVVSQVNTWEYGDPRLENTTAANDADYGDDALAFEGEAGSFTFDHDEASLERGGTRWLGIPTADLAAGGYQRYWNVAEIDDQNGNGIWDGRRIAVIVRWPEGNGWRRLVVHAAKLNPDPAERL
ncbi:MAG: prepilin-type N-terminal cleavage/methylation domain-containing protein [Anaeromyxobacteraceae bacterium]|nr:prepilin-type N-terminal cleavage/methylation domain-containing protein [Anaeromyxobacteraceae bacterium]